MPPKTPLPETVYIMTQYKHEDCDGTPGVQQPEGYKTIAAANAAAKDLLIRTGEKYAKSINETGETYAHDEDDEGFYDGLLEGRRGEILSTVRVWKVEVSTGKPATAAKATNKAVASRPKANARKAPPSDDDDDDGDDDEDEEEEAPKQPAKKPNSKKAASEETSKKADNSRKQIPEGKKGCLKGLRVLFTGTFNTMDRNTSVATAKVYGAEIMPPNKLAETDYIILGTKAGQKKLDEINEKNLETITEEEFFQILENGLSQDKRNRVDARRKAEAEAAAAEGPAKKKAKR